MKKVAGIAAVVLVCALQAPVDFSQNNPPQLNPLVIKAQNEIGIARPGETIVLATADLWKGGKIADWKTIHVTDAATGQEIVSQAVDTNADGAMEQILFQSDFEGREVKTFVLKPGGARVPTKEQFKAYGRFVRERYDDFAWENDRIAHRMYGKALETWQAEPLTSSAVDVWCKRVRRLVINDWYMLDDYHADHGEGADFYSAGTSRGCGGNGIWENGKLCVSRNFIDTKVIANGPVRVMFELTYAPWDVNGRKVSEIKRITLDAGQNLDRFESYYKSAQDVPLSCAIGIRNFGSAAVKTSRKDGWLQTWEPLQKGKSGNLGCAIILDPAVLTDFTEVNGDNLLIARVPASGPAVYYAGFGWDRSGDFADAAAWDAYVQQSAQRVRSPLKITITAQ